MIMSQSNASSPSPVPWFQLRSSSNEVSGNRKNPGYRVKEEAEMGIENEACVKEEMGLDSEKQLFPKTDEPSITMKEETKERRSLWERGY